MTNEQLDILLGALQHCLDVIHDPESYNGYSNAHSGIGMLREKLITKETQ